MQDVFGALLRWYPGPWVLRVDRARVLVRTRTSRQELIGPGFGFWERPTTGPTHPFPAGTCSRGSREVTEPPYSPLGLLH